MATEPVDSRNGYVIFVEELTDWDQYLNGYLPAAGDTLEDHGRELTVWNRDPDVIEGDWNHDVTVVLEFPSVEDARAWYDGPAYEGVKPIRHDACEYAHAIVTPEFAPEDLPE